MNRTCILFVSTWMICLAAWVTRTNAAELDSADFDFKYSGSDIFDGEDFLNDWSVAGDTNVGELLDGASIELNARGNILMTQTPDNRNFWLQQDSENSPWENENGDSWSFEVRAHLIGTETDGDEPNNGFTLWGADGFQRGIAVIREDSVQSFGRPGEEFAEVTNDDGFHTYRFNYDSDEDLYLIWRDGTLLSEDGFLAQAATGNNRLIVGDCCSVANDLDPFWFEELEIEYIRYDLDGAFDPPAVEAIPGDFNNDGTLNSDDINLLVWESASGENDADFDLTNDNLVNRDDIKFWANELKNTWLGDADLDGEFGTGDFVIVFDVGKFELPVDADWTEGDWTGDHRFNSSDFVAAFADGGYEAGPRQAVAAVPEPSGLFLLGIGLLIVCRRRATCEI